MGLVTIRREAYRTLELYFYNNQKIMKEQRIESLDRFIEEVAMFGLATYKGYME